MPAAIDLCIRGNINSEVLRRTQEKATADIRVTKQDDEVTSIAMEEADAAVWNALVTDLITRPLAHDRNSTLKLVQNGSPGPDLYVNDQKMAEVLFTRAQLLEKMPQVVSSK